MELINILENKTSGNIYGLMGNINITTNNIFYRIVTDYKFPDTVAKYLNSPKALSSLKMVQLDAKYLNLTSEELSESEIKKINLAHALIENKDYLILDYFEKGLNHREKENFKRLFKRLTTGYNKIILLYTNDLTFLWEITSDITYVDNKGVINTFFKDQYYNLANVVDKPPIINFTDLLRNKNIKIDNYKNVLDLLKAIYRLKGD